ncbi:MAG: DUF3153 domain-containing protein [Synechococcaceae cyanobacterium ELA445]
MADEVLDRACGALDRGDYATCLTLLEPLADAHGPRTPFGARLRLVMATALMGQGAGERALRLCRSLRTCADPELRAEAKALEMVLEAPVLERPRNWSLTLPTLGEVESLQGRLARSSAGPRRRRDPDLPPPPPVGPTRSPWGFAAVLSLLLLLAALLGGCMQVTTMVHFPGPGRLQLEQSFVSVSGQRLPWQDRFAQELRRQELPHRLVRQGGDLVVRSPVLPIDQAVPWLQSSLAVAGSLGGLDLPTPALLIEERNWLIGVRQHLRLRFDLSSVQVWPGLELVVGLEPLALASIHQAQPLAPTARDGAVIWRLEPGVPNCLELRCWRWSPLGLGTVLILVILVLALSLQRLRWQVGFRLPELPA